MAHHEACQELFSFCRATLHHPGVHVMRHEPNGFRVHLLGHLDTVSWQWAARVHEGHLDLDAAAATASARQWALLASSIVMQHGKHKRALPAGLEPAIFGLEVRRLVSVRENQQTDHAREKERLQKHAKSDPDSKRACKK